MIDNYEPPKMRWLTLPLVFAWIVAWVSAFGMLSLSYWLLLPAVGLGLWLFVFTSTKEDIPYDRTRAAYMEYLSTVSVTDIVVAVNDPNRPAYTKQLIRCYLDGKHAGWFKSIRVAA